MGNTLEIRTGEVDMQPLSPERLVDLGERFGVVVRDNETGTLAEAVNEMTSSLDKVRELTPDKTNREIDNRPQREYQAPDDDPLNAIVTRCSITAEGNDSGELVDTTIGLKDIIAVAGIPMQCNSAVMSGFIPNEDATVVRRLLAAGGVIVAKTNLDEFAASASGVTGKSVPIRNPHDPDHTAGGSSGGSAAAVAAGSVDVALGTDTGGSIRIPAAFCGVTGLKPTYGLVPLSGVVENTYTQDHIGPITRSVKDAARVLDIIAGRDESDPASLQAAGRPSYRVGGYERAVDRAPDPDQFTIGLLENGYDEAISDPVEKRTKAACDDLSDFGASITSVSVPNYEYCRAIKNTVSFTELAAHWRTGAAPVRRGGTVNPDYQAEFAARSSAESGRLDEHYKSKLLSGARILEENDGQLYTCAQTAREVLRREFDAILTDVDVLMMPTVPQCAPRIESAADPGFDYGFFTRPANITRLPAITIPNGVHDGLPVGLQFMGAAFQEATILSIAAVAEGVLQQCQPE